MTLYPLTQPTPTRPPGYTNFRYFPLNALRESISLPTWLAIGSLFQVFLFVLPIRPYLAIAPAFIYLIFTIIDEAMDTFGLKRNKYLARIIPGKYTAVLPHEIDGFNHPAPKNDKICVLLLGSTINHSLGPLAPGAKTLGDHFLKMQTTLETNPKATGYLGSTIYTESGKNHTKAGNMILYYFKSLQDVHAFAAGPAHRAGWEWFGKMHAEYPHLGLWHEVFEAPAGKWETVYFNQKRVGLGGTEVAFEVGGREMWSAPVVKAVGGLRSTFGRLGMKGDSGVENM